MIQLVHVSSRLVHHQQLIIERHEKKNYHKSPRSKNALCKTKSSNTDRRIESRYSYIKYILRYFTIPLTRHDFKHHIFRLRRFSVFIFQSWWSCLLLQSDMKSIGMKGLSVRQKKIVCEKGS